MRIVDALERHDVDLVAMAGFGTVLGQPVHDAYGGRIINTHPALLPAVKAGTPCATPSRFGVKITGCTIHVAGLAVDTGPILAQEAVPVLDGDTVGDAPGAHQGGGAAPLPGDAAPHHRAGPGPRVTHARATNHQPPEANPSGTNRKDPTP